MPIPLFLIEDEELVCELLGEFLKGEEDIEFLGEARDGASAIVKCRELKPEMIILDLRLPEISGLDVLKILHKELPNSKVIIFTGSLSEETLQSTLQNGAIAYVEGEGVRARGAEKGARGRQKGREILQSQHCPAGGRLPILRTLCGHPAASESAKACSIPALKASMDFLSCSCQIRGVSF